MPEWFTDPRCEKDARGLMAKHWPRCKCGWRPALHVADDGPADSVVCDCCGRGAPRCEVRASLPGWVVHFGLPSRLCTDCLTVWYDEGVTDPTEIRRRVLAKAGA